MKKQLSTVLRLSALSIALIAAGCGGGGGSSSAADAVSISGTAAKGIIKNGVVQVYAVDAQGTKGTTPIATGTTGADGTFTVSIPKNVLLFVVEVSAGANTVMADEATGSDLPMPSGMTMRSVVALDEGTTTYTGAVTPLTELAVKVAESTGGLTTANVKQAEQEMFGRFGFYPNKVTPVNSNSDSAANASDEQKKQALILAGISKLARDGDAALGCAAADFTCVVENITNTSESGVKDVVTKLETAANAAATDPAINKTGTTVVQVPNRPAPPPANEAPVDSAKKLFASLRTNLNAIIESETALEERANKVVNSFQSTVLSVDTEFVNWVNASTRAIRYLNAYKNGEKSATNISLAGIGGCIVYGADGMTPATGAADAASIGCSINRKDTATDTRVVHAISITPSGAGVYSYSTRARRETWDGSKWTNYTTVGDQGTGTIAYNAASYSVDGKLPARVDLDGNKLTDYDDVDVYANMNYDGDMTTYAVRGNAASYLGGSRISRVTIGNDSVLKLKGDTGDQPSVAAAQEVVLSITAESASSKVTGSLSMTGWKNDISGELNVPAVAKFEGAVEEAGKPFFSGTLSYTNSGIEQFDASKAITATNFLSQTASLSGKLAIPNRPSLDLFLSATPLSDGTIDMTVQYDDGSVALNFTGKRSVDDELISANVLSSSGISVMVSAVDVANKATVDVKKGEVVVGRLNLDTGIINYTDGSFESLK